MLNNLTPLVSVVMPCLDAEETIDEAIKSVLSQSYENIELLVIDNGSLDATVDIVLRYCRFDSRVLLLREYEHRGVSFARNVGIERARGKYICFLDSDDFFTPDSVKLRVDFAESRALEIVYGSYKRINSMGRVSLVCPPKKISYLDMLKKNHIGNLTGFYNAKLLGKIMQKNVRHEDYLMWVMMLRDVECAYSVGVVPLGFYRVSGDSLSGNKLKSFVWHWVVLRGELKLPLLRAIYYQLHYFLSSVFGRLSSVVL